MPTAVYEEPDLTQFNDLQQELQSPEINLLFVTDRQWDTADGGHYTYKRSRSMELGSMDLDLGQEWTWDELVDWTVSGDDDVNLPEPEFLGVSRLVQFPETPPVFTEGPNGELALEQEWQAQYQAAKSKMQGEVRRRLALAPVKEIVLSVHGIQTDLKKTAAALGLWWHLGGRQRVPVAYSWPAGKKGLLSFYAYDRESGEFTNFHLKQTLRLLAEMPEVEGIHILGHSRGTDVVLTAVRELILVERAAGRDPKETLKFKNLVQVAADIDFEVVSQRFEAEGLWPAFDRITVYATSKDYALSGAQSIFASEVRLGQLTPDAVPEYFKGARWAKRNMDIVFYEGSFEGKAVSSHSYYLSPSVGADTILLVRGHAPGAENGRPMEKVGDHMFIIRDDYLK
jgi:esterase/lipase superfamily enzyme